MATTKTAFPHAAFSYGLDRPVAKRVLYVDSAKDNASDGNLGDSWERPLATIEGAFNHGDCEAGTVIYVAPSHSESITAAAGIDADVAGVSVVGLGNGRNRPTITFSTATTADIDIDAANITFENLYFDVTGVDAVVAALDVNAANFTLKNCEVLMADSGGQAVEFILTDANADRMRVEDCIIRAPNAGANNAISLVGATDGIEILNNHIYGDFADGCIHNPTSNVATNVRIEGNYLQNDQTGDHAIELVSAVTGLIKDNVLVSSLETASIDPGSCHCVNNKWFDSDATDNTAVTVPLGPAGPLDWRVASKSIADASSTHTTGASPVTEFTVTGVVAILGIFLEVDTAFTSTSSNGTLAIGVTGSTALLCTQDTVDGTAFAQHDVWSGAADNPGVAVPNSGAPVIVNGDGTDIITTVATNDMTAGAGVLYCIWAPISAGANVVGA